LIGRLCAIKGKDQAKKKRKGVEKKGKKKRKENSVGVFTHYNIPIWWSDLKKKKEKKPGKKRGGQKGGEKLNWPYWCNLFPLESGEVEKCKGGEREWRKG